MGELDQDLRASLKWPSLQTSEEKNIIHWGLGSYQILLSGSSFRGVKVQGLLPLLILKGHRAWIPQSLDIIPRPCDISLPVLYCLSILAISKSLSLRNLVRICVRHVEFVKKPVDKTWRGLKKNIPTIEGKVWVPSWHLPLSGDSFLLLASAGFCAFIVGQLIACVFGSQHKTYLGLFFLAYTKYRIIIKYIVLSCFTPQNIRLQT